MVKYGGFKSWQQWANAQATANEDRGTFRQQALKERGIPTEYGNDETPLTAAQRVAMRRERNRNFGAVPPTAVPKNYNTGATRSGKAIRPKQADDTGFAPGAMLLPGMLALPGWPAKVAGTATGLIYSMAVTGSRPTPKQIEEAYIRGENANQYKPIDGSITSYTPTTEPDGVVTVQTQPIVQRLLLTNSGSAPEDPPEPARTTQNVGVSSFSSGGGGGGGGGPVGVVTGGGGGGGTDSCLICAVAAAGLALAIS